MSALILRGKSLILVILLISNTHKVFGQKVGYDYAQKYEPIATKIMYQTGIPASIILGVSMIESAMGKSKNCKLLNNFFGVKGKNKLHLGNSGHHSAYKQYETPEASFIDFARIVKSKKYYPLLKGKMDYKKWLHTMNKHGYAEAKGVWINDITSVIVKYKLTQYDREGTYYFEENSPIWGINAIMLQRYQEK
jgi:flagellum-specific peptidoglycan hydrolase FlgJ